jgi:hypothetical protein
VAKAVDLLNPGDDDEPRREDVDYRLEHFVLNPDARGVGSIDIAEAITDTNLVLTIEGASTLEITVLDKDLRLLNGDLLVGWAWGTNADDRDEAHWIKDGRAVDAKLDDLWFRLVKVEKQSRDTLVLTFEDRLVALLRAHRGARKVYRDQFTRAEFVDALCRAAGVPTYIPELHVAQPIAAPSDQTFSATTTTTKERRRKGHKGVDRSAHLTAKGQALSAQQIADLETALDIASRLNAPRLAVEALLVAGIGESGFDRHAVEQVYGTHKGIWQSNIIPPNNVAGQAWHFLHGGQSFLAGGALKLARENPGMSPGEIALRTEISDASGAAFYDRYIGEAHKMMRAYHGGSLSTSTRTDTSLEVTVQKPFPFARGKNENSWAAIQRLAQEVNFRAFVRQGVLWYVSEEFLFNQAPQLDVVEGEDGIDEVTFAIDVGAKNLVTELQTTARANRWTVLPGMVAMVHKQGAADGRWIVHQAERPLDDPQVTVTLNKSIPIKPEPAPETETTSLTVEGQQTSTSLPKGAAGPVGKVLNKAVEISRRNYQYSWGGGHNSSFAPSGPHNGYDCSGYVSACLHAAGLLGSPLDSSSLESWGQAGRGRYFTVYANSEHTFIVFHGLGKYKRADTSPQGGEPRRGPHVRTRDRSTAGFTARHAKGL